MNNLPIELVNKIIMMNRPIYPFMSGLKNNLTSRRRTTEKRNLNTLYGKILMKL